MTKDEAIAQVLTTRRCTPEQYAAIQGREWDGTSRFIWLPGHLDVGYPIRPSHASQAGSKPNPNSDAQRQPWLELGISQATYYRRKYAERKWAETFASLNALDTPPNRALYLSLAKAASLVGKPVSALWAAHVETLNSTAPRVALESLPSSSSLHDNGDEDAPLSSPLPLTLKRMSELSD